ncbi:MAG: NusG domain II-containing protein [Oscillospiraceae bacterium]|nr:NusG domain II-containing protein [Oscillospiraceae bacterium]
MKEHKRDFILIGVLLLCALLLLFVLKGGQRKEEGAVAVVTVDGTEIGRYPLSRDGTFLLNGGSNTLVIEDGEAWVSEANCPDKLCTGFGKISRNGQIIVCLPNKLIVSVEGGEEAEVDAVA